MNLRFFTVVISFAGLVFLTYREAVLGQLLAPYTAFISDTTLWLLKSAGMEVTKEASVFIHPTGFAYEIYFRCTGILPVGCLIAFTAGYRARWRQKLTGLAVGIPVILAINQVRLVHLYFVGVYYPASFAWVHDVFWEGAIVLTVFLCWWTWKRRVDGGLKNTTIRGRAGKERIMGHPAN